jgi:hypothetical protein
MSSGSSLSEEPTESDTAYVIEVLGRPTRSTWRVAARNAAGRPAVIENPPFLADGTPMPTRHWLVDPDLLRRIGTLEAGGAVDRVEAELGEEVLARLHAEAAAERDALIAAGHDGPRPSGGVGGTRVGVKCLHAHAARHLAGFDDPVGRWVMDKLHAAPATASADGEIRA